MRRALGERAPEARQGPPARASFRNPKSSYAKSVAVVTCQQHEPWHISHVGYHSVASCRLGEVTPAVSATLVRTLTLAVGYPVEGEDSCQMVAC